ncbi:MAG: hypothetical protein AAGA30_17310, partial [Planctomycetota bacterium]
MHLNRELTQARHELAQAHQIFDEINRHPIAGPIVKIRGRILEWLSRFGQKKSVLPHPSSND